MAYPSDSKPRRRKQAVPTLQQMIRRRAASPSGVPKMGAGLIGRPVMDGGVPVRRRPGWQGMAQNPARSGLVGNRQMANRELGLRTTAAGLGLGADLNLPIRGYLPVEPTRGYTPPFQGGPTKGGGQQPGATPAPQGGPNPQVDPNAFLKDNYAGTRNPLEHLDWWAAHGWKFNPNTGRFRYVAQAGAPYNGPPLDGRPPGQGSGAGTGAGGGAGGGTGGGAGGGGDANNDGIPDNLPLDAYFEAQRRQLNDALMARLGYINPQREQVGADRALQEARLNTNEGVDTNRLLEQLASRGAFGGGTQVRDQGYLGTDYLRQRQDLASQVAQALSGLSQQESEAQSQYSSGLMEALLALAARQAASQYAVTPNS